MSSNNITRVLSVKHNIHKVLGWLGIAFFTYFIWMAWRAGDRGSFSVSLGFLALGCYMLVNVGSTHMDSDSIKYSLPLGRSYQIKWNEVKCIEMDREGGSIVFIGENKRLAMNGPRLWTGKDKKPMHELMIAQVEMYGIEVRQTQKALFKFSRNTRVEY